MANLYEEQPQDLRTKLIDRIEENRQTKAPIIRCLDEDLAGYFKSFLASSKQLAQEHKKEFKTDPESTKSLISGKLFELLIYAQYEKEQIAKHGDNPKIHRILSISKLLCSISSNPKESGINIGHDRIPDEVYIDISKEGNLVVFALGEAKLGDIDDRAIEQLSLNGSRKTIALICTQINEKTRDNSSQELSEEMLLIKKLLNGQILEVSRNIKIDLIVPSSKQSTFDASLRFKSQETQLTFDTICNTQRVDCKCSLFNREDISNMTNLIMHELAE